MGTAAAVLQRTQEQQQLKASAAWVRYRLEKEKKTDRRRKRGKVVLSSNNNCSSISGPGT